MQTADFNPDDFTQQGTSEADKTLLVRFFYKNRPDSAASAKEGRPMFKEVEYIEIRVPGNRDPQACRPATHADKTRFPQHYKAFKDRVEMPQVGWPLVEWPAISRSQAEELSFQSIKTVEQLASAPDTAISGIMGGYGLKEKAQKALADAANPEKVAEKTRELEEQNKQLMQQNSELAEQVTSLNKKVEKLLDKMLGDDAEEETPAPELAPSALDEKPAEEEEKVEETVEEAQTDETEDKAEAEAGEEEAGEEKTADEKPATKRRSRSKK